MLTPLPFVDLATQRRRLGPRLDQAIARVLEHGQFIMGPEVRELEEALARRSGAKHVISCSSGTDALALVLMAAGVGSGDAVICPSFTFCATAEVVAWLGASPVFADVDVATFNLDPSSVEEAVVVARKAGLRPVGVIPVDLFGLPAAYDALSGVAEANGLWILADAAQSFGASYRGRQVGSLAWATATSFFPAKPLGCYGDGGAIFTDDDRLAPLLRSLRVHGQGAHKYDNVRIGMAGRLDTLQAAILLQKLEVFSDELAQRRKAAEKYYQLLSGLSVTPSVPSDCESAWAQYTVKLSAERRDELAQKLNDKGIPTAIYYPRPVHSQLAYRAYPTATVSRSEHLSRCVLSLPMHAYLEEETQDRIAAALAECLTAS